MCKVIICANQKGGVAKSTSVVNLGIGLANKGKRVLVIDNDPQGSLTEALGYPQPDKLEITLANVMEWVLNEDDYDLKAGILHHEEGIDLMPANIELSGVETSLVGIMSSETTLREYIESVRDDYDYIKKKMIGEKKQQFFFIKPLTEAAERIILKMDFNALAERNIATPGFGKGDFVSYYIELKA